ncbi:hypothetical protein PUN28_012249 [Cardiocondyla obscurior]|uniref:Uncharacterized protein n=1 Tax=Cardiocondyla obscurior TaxID=286306 RepID=A0AAW2FD57_9HYME
MCYEPLCAVGELIKVVMNQPMSVKHSIFQHLKGRKVFKAPRKKYIPTNGILKYIAC